MTALDPETLAEIRTILGRECIVEVTVAFYDSSDDAREPIDIGATVEFDANTPAAELRDEMDAMLDSLKTLMATIATDERSA